MHQPFGTFDNTATMRRERWVNGELKFYAEAHLQPDGSRKVADYSELFGRSYELEGWGYWPDMPRAWT